MRRLLFIGLLLALCALTLGRGEARPDHSAAPLPVNGAGAPIEIRPHVPSGVTSLAAEPPDTTWFGGTVWSMANSRWEAIPGGTWTFDSGVGSHFVHDPESCKDPSLHAQMEGWTSVDLTVPDSEASFRRMGVADFTGTACVGSPAGLSGDYSFWVGLLQTEAEELCWVGGQGYGDSWSVCLEKSFAHDGWGSLQLEYGYVTDLEPSFDYTYVYCDTSGAGDDVLVATYNGITSGLAQYVLTAGNNLRTDSGPITIKFCFMSDGAYSDEDGLYLTTCSGLALDDILVSNLAAGGTVYDFSDFESGEDGWQSVDPYPCTSAGDFADLVHVDDLSPIPPGLLPCSVQDSVLVFYDFVSGEHPNWQNNVAVSPWIDLEAAGAAGLPAKFVEFGGYFDLPLKNYVFSKVMAQWYPDTCAYSGQAQVSPLQSTGFVYYFGGVPTCEFKRQDLSDLIPPHATQVRIALGIESYCYFYAGCTGVTNVTPIYDNVRFGTGDFTFVSTLQGAIDAASDGDTLWVPGGRFLGSGNRDLDFGGKNLVLIGSTGSEPTIIDGAGLGRAFIFHSGEDTTSVIDGFTIKSCQPYGSSPPYGDDGGAILVTNNSGVTIRNCTFTLNQTPNGSGGALALVDTARVNAFSCDFTGNIAAENGGGVYSFMHSVLNLDSCEVSGNSADYGGGIHLFTYGSGTRLTDCLVTQNSAINYPAGVYSYGDLRVRGGSVSGNLGTGLSGWGDVSGCTVQGNTGIGISGTFDVLDCLVEGNGGRGLFLAQGSARNCVIRNNTGGGLTLTCSEAVGCTIAGNSAPRGGGIEIQPIDNLPLFCWDSLVDSCLVVGNSAEEEGGGVYVSRAIGPFADGDHVRGFIRHSTIAGNRANAGGGVAALLDSQDSLLDLDRVALWGNHADSVGNDLHFIDSTAVVTVTCSAIDTTGIAGDAPVQFIGSQVYDYPVFCGPEPWYNAPTTAGDYHLATNSPCLPASSPCGELIGALGQGCSTLDTPDDKPPVTRAMLSVWPNPALGAVQIGFAVPGERAARVEIYDVAGRLIRTLEPAETVGAVAWDRRTDSGARATNGVYFLRLIGERETLSRRLVLLN